VPGSGTTTKKTPLVKGYNGNTFAATSYNDKLYGINLNSHFTDFRKCSTSTKTITP
jgi:hypothetical protein